MQAGYATGSKLLRGVFVHLIESQGIRGAGCVWHSPCLPGEGVLEIVRHDPDDKAWDRFVERHPRATVAHLAAWGPMIAQAYGHEVLPLAAVDSGDVVGVLPLVMMRSRLFGRRLVSMPFLDYGGILADPGSPAEAALGAAALAAARDRRADSAGLRQREPTGLSHPVADGRVTMLLPLSTEAAVWKALPSERRNRIRKGERNGLAAVWGGADLADEFYEVWAANMRDLGSPAHACRFFTLMLEALPGTARVLLVRDAGGRAIGAAVCLLFRDTIAVPWVSSRRGAFALCPNFTLYWEAIRFGCQHGYRALDLGRSMRSAGTFEFKRQWGAVPEPLPWIFVDVRCGAPPPPDRDTSRFTPFIEAWKRLPLPVANLVGPWIRGQVPN
jgi:serine/alanine adding enzyme